MKMTDKKTKKQTKKNPLKGKYLLKNKYLYFYLKIINFVSLFFLKNKKKNFEINQNFKKILLSDLGHLGDLFISSYIVDFLKKEFPKVEIGFLISSHCKDLVKLHPKVDKIHIIDHFRLNRSKASKFKKFIRYLKTKKNAIKDIKKENYDIAIDLRYYYPNSIYFFWKSKIPIRIGYNSAGFENFLTHHLRWEYKKKHVSLFQLDLMNFISMNFNNKKNDFLEKKPSFLMKGYLNNLPKQYILFHIGAGSEKKMWEKEKWKKLAINYKGFPIVFTGLGEKEKKIIDEITNENSNYINLADKLTLEDLIYVVKKAAAVICLDSLPMHIASFYGVLTFPIFCGINSHHHWVLKRENVKPIIKNYECSPCFEKIDCKKIPCLDNISVDDVLKKIRRYI